MSYRSMADIAESDGLQRRLAAAAASEQVPDPRGWVASHLLQYAASPGWSEAWDSAMVGHNHPGFDPGWDETVISDGMILSATQALRTAEEPDLLSEEQTDAAPTE